MERKFNYADLGQVSKKTVEKNKKLEGQAEQYLKEYYSKLNEEKKRAEDKKNEEVLSNARFSQSSPYMKNKARAKLAEDTLKYADRATTAVMTDVLSTVVENSLLLDTEDFAKLNPSFKEEIRETVKSLLENGDIELDVRDKRTLSIMEHVAKNIPQVNTGIYLNEQEIIDIVKKSTPAEINSAIESLSGDVKDRVANIVVKEQDEAAEIEKDVEEIRKVSGVPSEEEMQAAMPEIPQEVLSALEGAGIMLDQNGQFVDQEGKPVPQEAVEQILMQLQGGEGEVPAEGQEGEEPVSPEEEAMVDQQQVMEDPYADDEYLAYQQDGATPGFSQPGQSSVVPATANKNTAVEVGPDGTVKINIVREKFYREVPRQGILESLALNEAKEMIAEGKEYNGELALGNALVHLTILETFNASGLFSISDIDYKRMLNLPLRKRNLKEELGSAAAEPVHTSVAPKEHTPEASNDDVIDGQHAEEIKEIVVESITEADISRFNKYFKQDVLNEGFKEWFGHKVIGWSLGFIPDAMIDKMFSKVLAKLPEEKKKEVLAQNPTKEKKVEALRAGFRKAYEDAKVKSKIDGAANKIKSNLESEVNKVKKTQLQEDEKVSISDVKEVLIDKGVRTSIFSVIGSVLLNILGTILGAGAVTYGAALTAGLVLFASGFLTVFGLGAGISNILAGTSIKKDLKALSEELGSAAAEPVHTSKKPVEHTPEASNDDVIDGQHAEEIKEIVVESWKEKALRALNKQ